MKRINFDNYNLEALDWISIFLKLFNKGRASVSQTINGCLKEGSQKEYKKEIKKIFFISAQIIFKSKTEISKTTIEDLKLLFQENETLKILQQEFNVDLFGESENSSSEDLDNL